MYYLPIKPLKTRKVFKFLSIATLLCLFGTVLPGQVPQAQANTPMIDRLAGKDRVETAIHIAKWVWTGNNPARVYLANSQFPIDALTNGTAKDGPTLLVPTTPSPEQITNLADTISTLNPKSVVALGGSKVVTDTVLEQLSANRESQRFAGADRFETAIQIAQDRFPDAAETVYLVSGLAPNGQLPIDALTAGTLKNGPLLLVQPSIGPTETLLRALDSLKATRIVLIGGEAAISGHFENLMKSQITRETWEEAQKEETTPQPEPTEAENSTENTETAKEKQGVKEETENKAENEKETTCKVENEKGATEDSTTCTTKTEPYRPQTKWGVERIFGADRFETAVAISNIAFAPGQANRICVVNAQSPVDAVVTANSVMDCPILLQNKREKLSTLIAQEQQRLGNLKLLALGGVQKGEIVFWEPDPIPASRVIDVPYISQVFPYRAWVGCEATALLMGLQGRGYATNHNLRSFLAQMPISPNQDPQYGFVGSPYFPSEVLRTTIYPKPLAEFGSRFGPTADISGASMDQIILELRQGHPVVIYATLFWNAPYYRNFNINGQIQRLLRNNHAVLLDGWDESTQSFHVSDPYNYHKGRFFGNPYKYWMPRAKVEPIYNARHHAVVVR